MRRVTRDYLKITLACAVYGLTTALFVDPNNLAPGGVTGIAIVLNRLLTLGIGTWFFLLNIPILLLGLFKFGKRFLASTIFATSLISAFTNLAERYLSRYAVDDIVLGVVFGSILTSWAIGTIFKCHATTGGTDIIIKLLRLKYPYIKTGRLFFATDVVIVTAAGIVFGDLKAALYSLLFVLACSYIIDIVLYGRDGAKLLYIISDKSDAITARILKELDIGVTHIEGRGAFSGTDKQVILCAIKKRLEPEAESIVREEDPDAFMIVTSATEIFGEGYKSYFDEKI